MIALIKNGPNWMDWVFKFKNKEYTLGKYGEAWSDDYFTFRLGDKSAIDDIADLAFKQIPPEIGLVIDDPADNLIDLTVNHHSSPENSLLFINWGIHTKKWQAHLNPLLISATMYKICQNHFAEQFAYEIDDIYGIDSIYDIGESEFIELYFNFKFSYEENIGQSIDWAISHIEMVYHRAIEGELTRSEGIIKLV